MACSFVVKQLIASKLVTRSVVPFRPAVASNRRALNTKPFYDAFDRLSQTKIVSRLLNVHLLPSYTVCREKSEGVFPRFSLDIPGIMKTKESAEGLCVFLDWEAQSSAFSGIQVRLKHNVLYIIAYMQNDQLSRDYKSRVNLPPNTYEILESHIEDRGLLVTLQKVKKD